MKYGVFWSFEFQALSLQLLQAEVDASISMNSVNAVRCFLMPRMLPKIKMNLNYRLSNHLLR